MMAYGEYFTNMQSLFYNSINVKREYYSLYKDTLKRMASGDKVVLCGRWDILYRAYCAENELKINKENFKKYAESVVSDLSEQVKINPYLKFYIVGLSMTPNKNTVQLTNLDLKNTFLSMFFSENSFSNISDSEEIHTRILNNELIKMSLQHNNVYFIDRNIPLKNGEKYKLVNNSKPLFKDSLHYSALGGSIIGSYILNTISEKK